MNDEGVLRDLNGRLGQPLRRYALMPDLASHGAVLSVLQDLVAVGWRVGLAMEDGYWTVHASRTCEGWAIMATGTGSTLDGALWQLWLCLIETIRSRLDASWRLAS